MTAKDETDLLVEELELAVHPSCGCSRCELLTEAASRLTELNGALSAMRGALINSEERVRVLTKALERVDALVQAVHPAVEQIAVHQTQLDADGCLVGVSRQAADECAEALNQIAVVALAARAAAWDAPWAAARDAHCAEGEGVTTIGAAPALGGLNGSGKFAPDAPPEAIAPGNDRPTTCYECGHELAGPYCPACNPLSIRVWFLERAMKHVLPGFEPWSPQTARTAREEEGK